MHAKEFLISWFNSEQLAKFRKEMTEDVDESSLGNDWLLLMKTTALVSYYSVENLQTMVKLMKQKWFVTDAPFED